MNIKLKYILIWSFVLISNISCFYDSQPKIISKDGNLIIESAIDKNITFRVVGKGRIIAGEKDLITLLQGFNGKTNPIYPINQNIENYDELQNIHDLRNAVIQLNRNVSSILNVTSNLPSRVARIQQNLRNLNRRVNIIVRKLRANLCNTAPCKNGGYCIPIYDSFQCQCTNSWSGPTCEVDVDECALLAGTDLGCQNGAWCVNTPGSYRCTCSNGYSGLHCTERSVDCLKASPGALCGHGVCVPAKNDYGYQCICEQGWTTDGINPQCSNDVNECESNRNNCHSSCINLPGSFKCGPCPSGYTGNGLTCRDINECEQNNGGCSLSPRVDCINTEGSFRCGICPPGWTGDGRYCTPTASNDCPSNLNICHDQAKCELISGVPVCTCKPGWTGNGYGFNGCQQKAGSYCDAINVCKNGGTCVERNNRAQCVCLPGFDENNYCERLNPCLSNPCRNGGTCRASGNSFTCVCPRGTAGTYCTQIIGRCGGTLTDSEGTLKVNDFQQSMRCVWVLRTDVSKILEVKFSKFILDNSTTCTENWLQIHDGRNSASQIIGRFCGTSLPKGGTIHSSHNQMYMWLRTDGRPGQERGFELEWKSIDPICGGLTNLTWGKQFGVIKSPGYPGKSPPNRDCSWDFIAPYGKKLMFRFFEVHLGSTMNECDDYIEIVDSNEKTVKICEESLPQPQKSLSNKVTINFHTNQNGYDSAFQMHYEVVGGETNCGGRFTNKEGFIKSPTSDPDNEDTQRIICLYLIQQPIGTKVTFEFTKFALVDLTNCSFHSIEIFDGETETDPLLGRFCGYVIPANLTSTTNSLLIKYVTSPMLLSNPYLNVGFEAKYKLNCDQIYREADLSITSPGYPNPYLTDIDCIYEIYAPLNNIISLRMNQFSLSFQGEYCNFETDNVEVYTSLNGKKRYCKSPPSIILTKSNYLKLIFHSIDNPSNAIGFKATYRFEKLGCGGILDNANTTVSSFDINYYLYPTCEWIIVAPSNYSVSIRFDAFDLGSNNCNNSLSIFLNTTKTDKQFGNKYCKQSMPTTTIYPTNVVTLLLNISDTSQNSNIGFTAYYEFIDPSTQCGGNYTGGYGSLKSPNYPSEYPDDVDCIWIIHAPLGHQIELIVRNFSLENTTSRCTEDYLEVRNGRSITSSLIGKYCGTRIPSRLISFTNHLYIKFHSDWSLTEKGFFIEWEQASTGCGGQLDSYEGSIHSPHYPDIISDVAQCDWTIHAAAGSFIEFNITRFKNDINFCDGNRLQIFDGPNAFYPKMKLNCSDSNGIIRGASTNEKISVRFITSTEDSTNFILDYKAKCMVTLTTVHGTIESPNFPNLYPDNLHCIWRIVSKKSNKINLVFSHLDLEAADQSCIYDSLTVFDLQNNERIKNQTLCRDKPYLITSISNTVEIEFKTDFSNGAKGFRLEYQINGCGEHLTSKFGSLESPNYPYSLNQYCLWVIEADYGKVVVLDVDKFYIDPDNRDCKSNMLVISNYLNDSHPIVNACDETIRKVTSSGRMMYIRFETDAYHSQKYFKATYSFKKAQCGGIIDASVTDITSPNYPYDYPPNIYCEWYIRVNFYHYVEISFVTFDLENSTNCENDYVEIYSEYGKNPNNLLLKHCGPNLPKLNLFMSKKYELFMIFKTNNATQKSGWKIHTQKLCGRDLANSSTGSLIKNINDNECVWKLSTEKEGAHFTLTINKMECACDGLDEQNCENKNGIEVYDGDSKQSPLKVKFCKKHPAQIVSNGQKLTVVGKTGSFFLTFTMYERMCGGPFLSSEGKFSSPLYPNSYPSDVSCIYSIKAAAGSFIELTFEKIDLPESENCNSDYIEIRAKILSGKLLGLFCGNVLPATLTTFEEMYVIFRSSKDSTGTGFLASYRNVHENEITEEIASNKGTISSPSIIDVRNDPKPYSWRIMAEIGKVIMLNFKEYSQGLYVFDGFDETAMAIDLQHSPFTKISSSSIIYITTSNKNIQKFKIEWNIIDKDSFNNNDTKCNEILAIDPQTKKNISSPNYPNPYGLNVDCDWIFKPTDQTTHIEFKLHAADLESFPDCSADYLTIFSGNNLNDWKKEITQCSLPYSSTPHNTSIGTPYLKISFHSDGSLGGTGFTGIAFVGCGGFMTEPIGTIDSDAISFVNSSTQECVWNIELRPGRKIELNFEFESDETETDSRCPNLYALIRDGLDADAPIMKPGRICIESQATNSIITTSNRAYIKFYFGRKRTVPWQLIYREHSECGGEIHLTYYANSTNISTPNYPNIPNPHSECIWIFIAPVGRTIELKIIDRFDFKINYNCDKEYVELRDGSTNLARQIGKFCENPGVQRSSSNIMYMKFMSDVPEPKTGFTASVSISKCGGMFTQYKGTIRSENYPLPGGYKSNSACEYSIKVPTFYRLNLTLSDIHLPYDINGNLNETDHLIIYSISETQSQRYEEIVTVLFGNNELKFITVDSNEVMIKFFTYKQNNIYRGFKIKFERVLGRCYKDVQDDSGELIMPRPTGRSMYVACRWKITVPKGKRISAKVTEIRFDTDDGEPLYRPSHRITFYNDFSMYSKIIQVTNVTMDEIKSSDNQMLIKIYGGYKSKLIGLKVEYTSNELSLCPADIPRETKAGDIKLSNDYANINYFCKSSIELNAGETIGYHIKNIQITGNNYMHVQPLRFKISAFWSFKEYDKNETNSNVAISAKSHSIEIIQLNNVKIFDLELKYKKHACGGEIIADVDTVITMSNITSNLINLTDYGRIDCAWELKFNDDLNFTGSTNFSKDCLQEYISIHNGMFASGVEKKHACGVSTFNFTATRRYIYMHYHNEEFSNKSSFIIENKPLVVCGGKLSSYYTNKDLHFTKKDYKNDLECVWDFEGKTGFSVAIAFTGRFFIESSTNCEKDYLKIGIMERNGNYKWFPKYCGRNTPDIINTTSDKIRIIFRSDSDITGDGFSLQFRQTCGGIYNASTNIQKIISPKDWNIYSHALKCNYTIIGQAGGFVNVKFTKFDLNRGNLYNSEPCQYAKITVYKLAGFYDTIPTIVGEYCDDNSIDEIRAKDFITLIYDASLDDGANFAFDYYLESCGGTITKDSIIQTPFDQEGKAYANNMECIWNITSPSDKDISIRFKYLDYEQAYNCLYDFVSVFQGLEMKLEKRKGLFCGNFSADPPHVKIFGNQAIVYTKSDEYTGGKGFSAEIAFVRKCDKHIHYSSSNSTYSHVELDYYTSTGYENDLDCHIWYSVDKGYQIEVEFEDFNVLDCAGGDTTSTGKQDPDCKCDFIEIFDSNNIYTKSIGKYCGSEEPTVFQTTGPNLMIRLVTDGSKSGRGFKASITRKLSICGETEIDLDLKNNLVLHSPNYGLADYPSNVFCRWIINANTSYKIHFDKFDLEPVSPSEKCNDYLQIIDIADSYVLNKHNYIYCGNETPSDLVFNTNGYSSDEIKTEILFRSNGRDQRTGFQITLVEISICNRTFFEKSGQILRFKLPVICKLYFEVPKHNYLSFYLPPNYDYYGKSNCSLDIKFYDTENNELLKAVCADGMYIAQQVFSKTNKLYIEMKRPADENNVRVDIFYIANTQGIGCGGILDNVQGYISSPLYPDNYRNYTNCRWDITVPLNNIISVTFQDFDMGSKVNCRNDYVQFIDINRNGEETVKQQYCGEDNPAAFKSDSNKLAVVYKRTLNFDGKGWVLHYNAMQNDKHNGVVILTN